VSAGLYYFALYPSRTGAKFFSWEPGAWSLAENMKVISEAAARGSKFICSSSAWEATGVFKQEVDLLVSKGYQIALDGMSLTPK
jgi:hypothetical protein